MTEGDAPGIAGLERADRSFEAFVAGSADRLFSMALLLTGHNRAEAEDLLQGVLERAYRRWRRICQAGDPEPYVRKMLVNASVDLWRRLHRRPEQPLRADADWVAATDRAAEIADRDLLLRAMAQLPAGQRAVLVLRYFSDLSEVQTAATLGCTVGSVKSQAARGLARLRAIADSADQATGRASGAAVRR